MKYLVKETSIATPNNPNFAGDVSIWYYGKGERAVKREGTHRSCDNFDYTDYMLNEYGYNRKCDAKRAYAYKHPENTEYWTSTVEIIEVEEKVSKFGEWELVVLWDTDDEDVYEYATEEEALQGGKNMKMALGNQITWWGIRRA